MNMGELAWMNVATQHREALEDAERMLLAAEGLAEAARRVPLLGADTPLAQERLRMLVEALAAYDAACGKSVGRDPYHTYDCECQTCSD